MEITHNSYITQYGNGAQLRVTYYDKPNPKYPYADRIELELKTANKKTIGFRMTFAEALLVIQYLSSALNAFVSDSSKPHFDIPLEATR